MTNKGIKIARTIIIAAILASIAVMGVNIYCQNKVEKLTHRFTISNAKRKAVYLSFIAHNEEKELQKLLVDLLQDDLIWMNKITNNNNNFYEICIG